MLDFAQLQKTQSHKIKRYKEALFIDDFLPLLLYIYDTMLSSVSSVFVKLQSFLSAPIPRIQHCHRYCRNPP